MEVYKAAGPDYCVKEQEGQWGHLKALPDGPDETSCFFFDTIQDFINIF
jgi:hypothetical protein